MLMPDEQLNQIIQRLHLFVVEGDVHAVRPDDIADLLAELRELHAIREDLTAQIRQLKFDKNQLQAWNINHTRHALEQLCGLEDDARQAAAEQAGGNGVPC